jgi:hypothetical protein
VSRFQIHPENVSERLLSPFHKRWNSDLGHFHYQTKRLALQSSSHSTPAKHQYFKKIVIVKLVDLTCQEEKQRINSKYLRFGQIIIFLPIPKVFATTLASCGILRLG